MTLHLWLAFVAACVVILVIPGPTILTVVSYSVTHGSRANICLIAAVALGDSTALLLSLLGLGALLALSSVWFTVVKVVGGCYLLYLGVSLIRAGHAPVNITTPRTPDSLWRLFFNTWLVTALNPKGMVFFIAFMPQFIDPSNPVTPQLWILSATFVVLATLNASIYAVFASVVRERLSSPRAQRGFHLTGGSMLCVAGLWALSAGKSS